MESEFTKYVLDKITKAILEGLPFKVDNIDVGFKHQITRIPTNDGGFKFKRGCFLYWKQSKSFEDFKHMWG